MIGLSSCPDGVENRFKDAIYKIRIENPEGSGEIDYSKIAFGCSGKCSFILLKQEG